MSNETTSGSKDLTATLPADCASAALFELVRLIARHAVQQDLNALEKDENNHDKAG